MTQIEFIGCLAVYGIVFIAGIIGLIKPIITLNVNIQKLSDSIDKLSIDTVGLRADVDKHTEELRDHETRLVLVERGRKNEQ